MRRGHPNDKPRTERSFWEVERSFLNGREFRDLTDMRAQLAHWLETVVDLRRHHKRTALERFAQEREHPAHSAPSPVRHGTRHYRLCSIDGFVAWDGSRYAVPYDHVTDILPVRVTQHELFVYGADLHCVARHELAPRGANLSLDPAGLHPPPRREARIDLDQIHVAFVNMGENAARFFRMMSIDPPRVWSAQARQILLLRDRYTTEDVDLALGHAASFGAFDRAAVERILAVRATSPQLLSQITIELRDALRVRLHISEPSRDTRDKCATWGVLLSLFCSCTPPPPARRAGGVNPKAPRQRGRAQREG